MSEWKEYKLGDLIERSKANLQTGPFGTMLSASEYSTDGVPVIAVQDIGDNKLEYHKFVFVNQEVADRLSRYRVKENDIIFGRKGATDRRAIVKKNEEGWLQGSDCIRLRLDETINAKFISYQLGSRFFKEWMLQFSVGATMPSLNQEILKLLPLRLPILKYQNLITEVLSSLDDKIDLLHRQNKTLEQLAETLFRQWIVEEAEEGWEVGTLGDVISIYDNQRVPVSRMEREKMKIGELYPYYGAATIMDYVNAYIFDGEYVLMGEDGTVQTDDGYPILQLPVGKFWVNNHTHIFQAKKPFSNFFIYIFLKRTNISSIVTGAVQPKINQQALKSIEFIFPDKKLLDKYIETTNNFWNKIKNNNYQIRTLTKLRDVLLPKLMSGDVRVKI